MLTVWLASQDVLPARMELLVILVMSLIIGSKLEKSVNVQLPSSKTPLTNAKPVSWGALTVMMLHLVTHATLLKALSSKIIFANVLPELDSTSTSVPLADSAVWSATRTPVLIVTPLNISSTKIHQLMTAFVMDQTTGKSMPLLLNAFAQMDSSKIRTPLARLVLWNAVLAFP